MGERHVEDLFSAAYDDALTPAERERYDAHLAGCERCAAAAGEFRAAIDSVRALPQARMPVRVVLPATPPVAERRTWLPPLRLPRLGPAWGAGVMGVAGIAAVVVAVHAHGGSSAGSATTALSPDRHAMAGAVPREGAGTGGKMASQAVTCAEPVLSVTSLTSGASAAPSSPVGFSNRVAVTNPQRPGQELVLATTSSHYSPGEQVLVYAALTTSSARPAAVVPCVTLLNAAVAAAPAAGSAGGGATQSPSTGPNASSGGSAPSRDLADTGLSSLSGVPLAIAIPTSQSIAGTLPVQVLTIPADLPRGTVLHLVAVIPAGVPGASDQPSVEAVLTVVVA